MRAAEPSAPYRGVGVTPRDRAKRTSVAVLRDEVERLKDDAEQLEGEKIGLEEEIKSLKRQIADEVFDHDSDVLIHPLSDAKYVAHDLLKRMPEVAETLSVEIIPTYRRIV